jgi:hypothetical protein
MSGIVGKVYVEIVIPVAELGEEVEKCLVKWTVYNQLILRFARQGIFSGLWNDINLLTS